MERSAKNVARKVGKRHRDKTIRFENYNINKLQHMNKASK